jgi:hypothetical protein
MEPTERRTPQGLRHKGTQEESAVTVEQIHVITEQVLTGVAVVESDPKEDGACEAVREKKVLEVAGSGPVN